MARRKSASRYRALQTWYIETSAVNHLQSLHGPEGLGTLATRALQQEKGRRWCISPVTIWEIIQTESDSKREELIDFSQHIFSRDLLLPPEDLIVGFIENGMLLNEPRRNLISNTELGKAWSDIVDDPRKTLNFDKSEVRKRGSFLKSFSKNIHLIERDSDKLLQSDMIHAHIDVSLTDLVNAAAKNSGRGPLDAESLRFHKIVMFYIVLILCIGMGFDSRVVEAFWMRKKLHDVNSRLQYVVTRIPNLMYRGPFILMAYMTQAQLRSGFSRGLWFDCLHSVYISYVEFFITNDADFIALRDDLPNRRMKQVVSHFDEMEFFKVRKDWLGRTI